MASEDPMVASWNPAMAGLAMASFTGGKAPVLSIIRNTLVNLELWRETIKLII